MKLIDMKMPKQEAEKLAQPATKSEDLPRYPYGLQLRFEYEEVEKIPALKNMKVGETVKVEGLGTIKSVSMSERENGKKQYSVEIQIERIGVVSTQDYDESFKEAVGKQGREAAAQKAIDAEEGMMMR